MDPDEHEEELRVGGEPAANRLRRPGMVVLVALAGLAAAWVVKSLDNGTETTARPTPTVSAPTAIASSGGSIVPISRPSVTRVPSCPAGARCQATADLPAAVVAAVRDRYPGARVESSRTLFAAGGGNGASLLRRTVTIVAGRRHLDIVITPFVLGPDDFDRQNAGTSSTVMVKSTGAGKTVQVTLVEPKVARPNDLVVLRLARDPRLAALQ